MLWIKDHIARIEALVASGDPESLTLAALRARLALELVCYERLRLAHDYISPDDLRRWQPKDVVQKLIQEVDPNVGSDLILSIREEPIADDEVGIPPDQFEYIEVGRQKGLDARLIGKLWNSLGSFLHVPMPRDKGADLSTFGDLVKLERKVHETLSLLTNLSEATLIAGGIGETVKFECNCGRLNQRRANLLRHGQVISCMNSECREQWIVEIASEGINFNRYSFPVACRSCSGEAPIPYRMVMELNREQFLSFYCDECGVKNIVVWRLMQAADPSPAQDAGGPAITDDQGPA